MDWPHALPTTAKKCPNGLRKAVICDRRQRVKRTHWPADQSQAGFSLRNVKAMYLPTRIRTFDSVSSVRSIKVPQREYIVFAQVDGCRLQNAAGLKIGHNVLSSRASDFDRLSIF